MLYNNKIRKLFLAAITLVFIVGLFFLTLELLKSTVEISSETNTNVKVFRLPDNEEVFDSSDKEIHSIKLSRGSYTIEVSKGELVTKKTLSVGFRNSFSFSITPEDFKGLVKTSDQKISSIGVFKNEVVGLNNNTPVLVNEAGDIVYSQFEFPIQSVVYANNNQFGEIRKNGDFALTTNSIPIVLHSSETEEANRNPVIDADFNVEKGEFCLLLENGIVKNISLEEDISQELTVNENNNVIRCRGDIVATGIYAKFSDGDNKIGTTPGILYVYESGNLIKEIESVELNAVDIGSNTVIYTDNKVVSAYDIVDDTLTEKQTIESLGENSLFVRDNNEVYVFDEDSVWLLDIGESISKKISSGFNFRSVNSVGEDVEGNVVLALDSRSFDSGIYSFTENSKLAETESKIRASLPKKDYFYSADYTIVDGRIVVEVAIYGDIPSTQQSKQVALLKAQEYISSLKLDPSIEVIYK